MGRADVEADVAAVNAAGGNVPHAFQLQEDGFSFVVNAGGASGTITVLLDVDDYPKHTYALFTAEGDIQALEKLAATLQQRFCGGGRLIDIEQFVRQSMASPKLARLREHDRMRVVREGLQESERPHTTQVFTGGGVS